MAIKRRGKSPSSLPHAVTFLSDNSLLRQKPFLRFWLARINAAAANQMLTVAVAWQVYQLTGSAMDLGLVGLCQFLPRLLLTATAGNMADSHDRKRIAVLAQMLQCLTLGALLLLTLTDTISRHWIFLLVAVSGTARAFDMPATSALLPRLVEGNQLSKAVALSASAMQAAFIIGPALGGLLYAFGATTVYGVTLALFIFATFTFQALPPQPPLMAGQPGGEWQKFIDGLAFIRSQKVVLGAISLDMFAVLFGGATSLMPIIAEELLHTGAWGLGLLRSAPAVGALVMSFWLARHPLDKRVGHILFVSVAIFSFATIGFGLSTHLGLSLAILALLGAADMVSVVIRGSLVQLQTPDHMRGRVSAVNSIFIGASNQLGEFESGVTAAWFGAVPAVILGGVLSLGVTVCWMIWFPQLRKAESLQGH